MDITYAKELLEMLADGVDPNTGEGAVKIYAQIYLQAPAE